MESIQLIQFISNIYWRDKNKGRLWKGLDWK